MKADRDHLDYLQDILAMMEKIERFTAGMEQEDFIEDNLAHFAVIGKQAEDPFFSREG